MSKRYKQNDEIEYISTTRVLRRGIICKHTLFISFEVQKSMFHTYFCLRQMVVVSGNHKEPISGSLT
jgi:hypothetical protein